MHLETVHDQKGHLVSLFLVQESIKREECKYSKSVPVCGLSLGVESANSAECWLQNACVCSEFFKQMSFKQRILFKNVEILASE